MNEQASAPLANGHKRGVAADTRIASCMMAGGGKRRRRGLRLCTAQGGGGKGGARSPSSPPQPRPWAIDRDRGRPRCHRDRHSAGGQWGRRARADGALLCRGGRRSRCACGLGVPAGVQGAAPAAPPPPMPDAVAAAAVVAALSARLASVGRVVGWVVGSVGGRDSIGSVESRGAPTKWSLGVVCVEAVAVETRKGRDGECRGATDVRACAAAAAAPWRVHRGVRRGSPACRGGASHGGRGIVGELSTYGGCRRHSHSGFGVCQTQKTRAPAAVARHAR